MCGLAGILTLGGLSNDEIGSFEDLMTVSQLRGRTGAGIVAVRENGKANIIRSQQTSSHLMADKVYFDLLKKRPIRAMMGHCRLPTRGTTKGFENVHPHRSGKIIGMHNGTMSRVMEQTCKADESDSRLLFNAIGAHGLQKVIDDSWGAMALSWYDDEAETLNLYHNYERPLHVAQNKTQSTIWWGSEVWMLYASARRRCGEVECESLAENTLYTYHLDQKGKIEPEKTKIERKPLVYNYSGCNWREDFDDNLGKPYGGGRTDLRAAMAERRRKALAIVDQRKKSSVPTIPLSASTSLVTIHDLEPGRGRGATIRSLDGTVQFMNHAYNKLKKGCTWCGDPVAEEELVKRDLLFIDKDEFICSSCVAQNDPTMWAFMPKRQIPSKEELELCLGRRLHS